MTIKRRPKRVKKTYNMVVTGNRLTDGIVVYFNGKGWAYELEDAVTSLDGDALLQQALEFTKDEDYISIDVIKVDEVNDQHSAVTMKEKIRSDGPTTE